MTLTSPTDLPARSFVPVRVARGGWPALLLLWLLSLAHAQTSTPLVLIVTPSSVSLRQLVTAEANGLNPSVAYTLDWGDGESDSVTESSTVRNIHNYRQSGVYTVTLSAPGVTPATTSVTVTQPVPTLTATASGLSATLHLGNLLVDYPYEINWGDDSTETSYPNATAIELPHAYQKPGTYVIRITPQNAAPVTTTLTLAYPTPVLVLTPARVPVRQPVTADLSGLDPTLETTLNWGDTTSDTLTGSATAKKAHTYTQPGTYVVTVTSSGTTPVTSTVTVAVPVPTASATASALSATLNLGNLLTDYPYSVAWGDGTTEPLTPTTDTAQLKHTYAQPGVAVIQITPKDAAPVTASLTLTVPPAVLSVLPASAPVGQTVTANLSELTPALTYTLDWGDKTTDTITGAATGQKTHAYTQPGTYTVTLTSPGAAPVTAVVSTTVPTLTATAVGNGLNATLNLSNLLTDYSYTVAWGDGTTEPFNATTDTAQLKHTYTKPGTFTIQVTPQGSTPVTTTVTLSAPTPVLTVTPSNAAIRQTVTANLASLVPALTYTLDWGDKTSDTITGAATGQKTHAYTQPGTYTVTLTSPGAAPVTATVGATVPTLSAAATGSGLSATLNLSNLLTDYPYTVAWGDGTTEPFNATTDTAQLKHAYAQPGSFVIQVTPQGGTPVTTTVTLTAPTPVLTVTPSSAAIRQTVTANLTTLVPALTYTLDWGDKTSDTITGAATAQKTHAYTQPGTYTVTLTSPGAAPVTAVVSTTVPTLTATAVGNGLNATLNLGNLLTDYPYTVAWGDGTTEPLTPTTDAAQLKHTYAKPGTFTIQVIPQGTAPVTTTLTLSAPTPVLTVTPSSPAIRQTVTANLASLVPALTYTLDWGDKTTDTLTGAATGQKIHAYTQPGTYTVTLTSPEAAPVTAVVSATVPTPVLTVTSAALNATLNLGNLLSDYVYTVAWGDGTTEPLTPTTDAAQLKHTYAQPGSFVIQVTPQGGTPVTTTVTLTAPNSALTVTPSNTTIRQTVTANLTTLVPALTYTLDWGDKTSDTITGAATGQKNHVYTQPGTFTVSLSASGTTPATVSVIVGVPAPVLAATSSALSATLNLSNLLADYSYTVAWGDGTTEPFNATTDADQLKHAYTKPGTFTIQVTPQGGTPVTTTVTLTAPTPVLTVAPSNTTIRQTVTANLTILVPALTYTLDWGDKTTDTITGAATGQKTHTYTQPGTYTVTLTSPGIAPITTTVGATVPTPVLAVTSSALNAILNLGNLLTDYPYSVAWGDGTTEPFNATTDTAQLKHTYTQPSTFTIQVTPQGGTPVTTAVTLSAPTPVLTVTPSSAAIRQTVTANLASLVPALTYTLDWGDKTSDTLTGAATTQKTHAYTQPGTYTVTLTSPGTAPVTAVVGATVPTPVLTATSAALNATLNLSNLLSDYTYSIAWGDGTTEPFNATTDTAQLKHTYTQPGTFTIQVTPQGGAPVTTTLTLSAPTPVLTVTPSNAAIRQTVTANLTTLVPALTYTLDWGDKTTDTLTGAATGQKTHAYTQPGTYTVTLTSPETAPVTTTVGATVPAPVLTATSSALNAALNLSNLLTDYPYTVVWGDGTTEPFNATTDAAQLKHAYAQPGSFVIRVTPQGGTPVTTTLTLSAPTPVLTVTPSNAAIRQTVTANLVSLVPALTYTLDWGDKTTDTITGAATAQKTHAYTQPGTYTVTLTSPGTAPVTTTVGATVPTLTATAAGNSLNAALNLSNLLSDYVYTVAWGDGTTEPLTPTTDAAQLKHTYAQPGSFVIQVTPQGGTPVTTTVTLTAPNSALTVTPSNTTIRQTVTANLTTLVPALTYTLDWGDKTTDTLTGAATGQKTHAYTQPGTFTVSLSASGTTPATVSVIVGVPAPTLTVTSAALNATLNLGNLLTDYSYTVAWGDGTTEPFNATTDADQLKHAYTKPGIFTIQVTPQGGTPVTTTVTLGLPTATLTVTAQRLDAVAELGQLVSGQLYTLNWGDTLIESFAATGAAARVPHSYAQPGSVTVTLSAVGLTPVSTVLRLSVPPALEVGASGLSADASFSQLIVNLTYTLDWGDGTTEPLTATTAETTRTHDYARPGTYAVRVSLPGGDSASASLTLAVPVAELTVTPAAPAPGQPVTANLTGLAPSLTYTLTWGDGTSDSLTGAASATRTHPYDAAGTFTLTLSAPDVMTVTASVVVGVPVPMLSVTQDQLTATLTVGNLLLTSSEQLAYRISWGDGSSDTFVNSGGTPTVQRLHTYARPGTFRIQVTPPAGGAPVSTSVTLSVPDPVLTLTPTSAAVGTPVTANVSGLGPSLSYVLSWGDDTTETLTGQSSFQRTHTYTQAGNFRAQVESVFAFVTVTVQAPVISATASNLNVTLNLGNLLPGYEYRIDWEYGVSETLTATAATAQLSHTYARPGRAIIVVTPLGGDGVSTTLVLSASSPVLNVTPAVVLPGESVTADLSNLLPGHYTLEWGDGSYEGVEGVTTAKRTHTYTTLGTFKVTLSSPDTSAVTATVTVKPPTPTLSVAPVSTPIRQPVTAKVADLRGELTYTLNWGDGAADTLTGVTTAQRTHAYDAPGTYTVTVGAPQTTSVTASVTASIPAPTATVVGDNALSATLNLGSLLNGYAYSVEWGDGTTETLNATAAAAQLSHTYTQPGTYTLKISTAGATPVTLSVLVGAPSPVLVVTPAEVENRVQAQVGQPITANLTALVPALSYTLIWGDGTQEVITGVTTTQRTHVYVQVGYFAIRTEQAQGYTSRGYQVFTTLPAPAFTAAADRLAANAVLTELIPVVNYTFDWGDGTPIVSMTGVTTSSLTHHYAALGDYTLLLTASDGVTGRSVRQTLSIRVEGGALTLSVQGLQVTAQLSGMLPELSYTLNWGDNTSETLTGVASATRTHNYALPRTYTATLSAPLVPGASATVTTVAQAPGLSVSAPNLTATAELSGLLPGVSYLLDWGDGAGQTLKDQPTATLTHRYPAPGTYTVKIGQAPYGLRLPGIPEASAPLTVALPPREAVLVIGQDDLGAGYHFRVTGLLPEGSYKIDFGDHIDIQRLTGGTDVSVDHTYLRSGTYTVTLLLETYPGEVVRATSVSQVQIALGIQLATLSFTQPYRDTDLKLNIAGPIEATLSLSYRGGGRLTGRWVLDGQPVENVDMTLPEATVRADADVKFTRTETRPGKHTLNFEFTGGVAPVFVRPVTYALNAPSTLTYGDFKVTVSTITKLIASPGRSTTLSGTGTVKLIVGGTPLSDVNVTFTDQQTSESGKVLNGPTVTAELGGQSVRNVRLGDLGLRVDRLSLSSDGGTLSGSVTLPVPGGASANLAFTDTPLAADSGDLLATLRLNSPIQNLKLPEDGLSFSAAAAVLDLSGTKNVSELTDAYKQQAPQQNDWMGLVFPAARLSVGTPILSQAVTLTVPVAYNLSGYVAALDLPATTSDVLGWRVDLSSLKASVLAGRISTTTGTGSVTLPLTAERMNVALGWNTNAKPGQRLTLSAPKNESVKNHSFGRTSLMLGEGVWTMNPDAASVTFSNARWFLDNQGNDVALNNLTMSGNGNVTLDGRPWSSVTGKTDLTVLGYPFAAAEVGVQRQSGGAYTLGLNGRLQVNENLPVNTTNTKTLFWVNGGKDVKVTDERIHLSGTVTKVPFEINLDGALTDDGLLEFSGPGKLNLAGLVNVDAKARFGRFTGTNFGYFKQGFGSVGYGSITVTARRNAELSKPLFSAKRVEFYELLGGLTVNMDWPNGLDAEPIFRTAGPSMLFQAGALISGQQDPSAENLFKPYLKGILTVDSVGAFDMRADAWLVKKGEPLKIGSPNGRALVSISAPILSFVGSSGGGSTLDSSPDGRLLVQACVGPSSISSPGGLNCSGLTDLNVYDLMTLRGSMELYAPFSGTDQHLYIGTKASPIVVNLSSLPQGRGFLMMDSKGVDIGAGVTWGFENGNSGSLLVCSWHWNIKATASLDAEFGVKYNPFVLDGAVKFGATAAASAGGCGIDISASTAMTFDGKVHVAPNDRYFEGSVSASVSLPVIPNINVDVKNLKVKF